MFYTESSGYNQTVNYPTEVGRYKAVIKLVYSGAGAAYALSEGKEVYFEIVKATFRPEEFTWQVRHGSTVANWDASNEIWVDAETGEPVDITYDRSEERRVGKECL